MSGWCMAPEGDRYELQPLVRAPSSRPGGRPPPFLLLASRAAFYPVALTTTPFAQVASKTLPCGDFYHDFGLAPNFRSTFTNAYASICARFGYASFLRA